MGSIIGGLGFVLPGLCGMLLLSYLYDKFGLQNKHVVASFHTIQITTCAMVFRATYKLAESALMNKAKTVFNWNAGLLCMFCFLTSILKLNFFISLAASGVMNTLFELAEKNKSYYLTFIGYLFGAGTIGFYGLYVSIHGVPSGSMIGSGSAASGTSYQELLQLGLIAGMVTFGGAYTTLPFIYAAAVTSGGWLTDSQFLDAIALTNMMPTPLVTFVTVVGWIGHGLGGSCLMAIGIFLPAFSFTLIGHNLFEAIVDNHYIHPFLDGVGAAVIGLLLFTAFQFLRSVVDSGLSCAVFFLSFAAIFHFTDKYTQVITLIFSAMVGQILNIYD
jgi:chromate transporter